MRSLSAADVLARTPHPSNLCRCCWWRPAAPGWATCTPCFFRPQRWRVPCSCSPVADHPVSAVQRVPNPTDETE